MRHDEPGVGEDLQDLQLACGVAGRLSSHGRSAPASPCHCRYFMASRRNSSSMVGDCSPIHRPYPGTSAKPTKVGVTKDASVRTPSSSGSSASKEWPSFVSGERSSNQRQNASASAIRSPVGSFGSPVTDAQLKACQKVRKLKSPDAASTFCSFVVPDRAVPITITGPVIGCSAISGWRRTSRCMRRRWASRRTSFCSKARRPRRRAAPAPCTAPGAGPSAARRSRRRRCRRRRPHATSP